LQTPVIEIRSFKELDISGGVFIEAFPSEGFVPTVVGSYIIGSLNLDQIAVMDSIWIPPVSMIYAQRPEFPARIYASSLHKIAVCISEVTMPVYLDRFIAKSILSWVDGQGCSLAVSLCRRSRAAEANTEQRRVGVLGVGSTDRARQILMDNGIPQLDFGVIPGITGALLNESKWNSTDLIALIVETYGEVSAARIAAAMVEAVDVLLPQIDLPVAQLCIEAEEIESRLKILREQAELAQSSIRPSPYG